MMDILTTKELADYLKLKEATIRKLASHGKLPAIKVGRQWRFKLDKILMLFPEIKLPDQADPTLSKKEGEEASG